MNLYTLANGNADVLRSQLRAFYSDQELKTWYSMLTDGTRINNMPEKEHRARAKAIEQILNLPHKAIELKEEIPMPVKKTYQKRY